MRDETPTTEQYITTGQVGQVILESMLATVRIRVDASEWPQLQQDLAPFARRINEIVSTARAAGVQAGLGLAAKRLHRALSVIVTSP